MRFLIKKLIQAKSVIDAVEKEAKATIIGVEQVEEEEKTAIEAVGFIAERHEYSEDEEE